jgi:Ca2+-binding EF-hand superfamily protein
MSKLSVFGACALALGLMAPAARAQAERKAGDIPGPIDSLQDVQDTGRMVFKMADTNNDGQISQQEAVEAANGVVGGFFFRADKDGNGTLTKDEARAARESFLASKPWLRYAVETAKATRAREGQANADTQAQNPLRGLATAFDTNNDKQLSATEVRQAVQTGVQTVFATADTNRDGQLSPAEVNAGIAGFGRQLAQASFQQADKDNDGQISEQEFIQAIEQPAKVAFNIADLNHDGKISQQEAQTARQVLMSKIRSLNLPEPANSPRHRLNSALGSQTAPAPAPATPAAPPVR